jgi:hypothetical protein
LQAVLTGSSSSSASSSASSSGDDDSSEPHGTCNADAKLPYIQRLEALLDMTVRDTEGTHRRNEPLPLVILLSCCLVRFVFLSNLYLHLSTQLR